jgi:hypothetical protein
VLTRTDDVLAAILTAINNAGPVPPHPDPLPSGERELTPSTRYTSGNRTKR